MNIVHIAANSPFNDGWGYQDNLLPKYQIKLGHTVTMLVTDTAHSDDGIVHVDEQKFKSVDGFDVVRFPYKQYPIKTLTKIFYRMEIYETLIDLQPDFIFFHGLLSRTFCDVIRYKKQREKSGKICVVVQDNHLDYNIGIQFSTFKQKLLRTYYRKFNKRTQRYVSRVYGVTPWRKMYAEDYFGISSEKTDVLIMGADDEKIDFLHRNKIRLALRKKFNVADDEFLVMTGGKIDRRKNVIPLLKACGTLKKVKLVVFGSILEDVKEEFMLLADSYSNVNFIGWVPADQVYDYFFASDLLFFPGQHSVLWEQACAAKIPCVFLRWEGMEHVDVGGNADFIECPSVDVIKEKIKDLCFTPRYYAMKSIAISNATNAFLYSEIAKKSIETCNGCGERLKYEV